MGTLNTKINGNDTFQDIYQDFFDRYNSGGDPAEITKKIIVEYKELFTDVDDRNNAVFALAFAQWETKSLNPKIFNIVKLIIESGNDIEVWKSLGADKSLLQKREKELINFYAKLSTERTKPKKRRKNKLNLEQNILIKIEAPDFKKVFEVTEIFTNGEYNYTGGLVSWATGGGAVVWYNKINKNISAKWLNDNTLQIIYDREIVFTKKESKTFYCGNEVYIEYVELENFSKL